MWRCGILKYNTKASETNPIYFYNNDDAKDFKVVIIGFDKENDTPYITMKF